MSALLRLSSIFSRGLDFPCGSAVHVADRSAAGCRQVLAPLAGDFFGRQDVVPIVRDCLPFPYSLRWAPFRRRCFDERFSFAGWLRRR